MRGTERVMIDMCSTCAAWSVHMKAPERTIARREIPGTAQVDDCKDRGMHGEWLNLGHAQAGRLAHWALTTVLMRESGTSAVRVSRRDTAHVLQEWIGCTNPHRRTAAPMGLFEVYGLSDYGMATARHVASLYAKTCEGPDVSYWLSVAAVLREPTARRG